MNVFSTRYKIPILMALVIAAILIVFRVSPHWLNALWVFGGVFLGIILIDLEYLLHAYVIDPSNEKSSQVKAYASSRSWNGLVGYLNENEHHFGELSVRSILFQVLLVFFAFYAITANVFILAQAMVLSMMAYLLYSQLIEYLRTGSIRRWFWIYNGEVSESTYKAYIVGMGLLLLLQFWLII